MNYTDLVTLAQTGSHFIYDLEAVSKHALLAKASAAKIFFACKANPLSSILLTFHNAGIPFDISSDGELRQLLSLGISGQNMSMTGPAKPEKLIRLGLEHQVATFVVESPSQINLLERLARDYSYKPNVLLRLQLNCIDAPKNVLCGNNITAFGMDIETARQVLSKMTLPFLGFHVFQWSSILSLDKLRNLWSTTIIECKKLTSHFQVLDFGGGIGIPYKKDDLPLTWNQLNGLVAELKETYQLNEFRLEMGRYLIGPFGIYITTVIDIKNTYNQNIIVLQGGINHMMMTPLANRTLPVELLRKTKAPLAQFSLHGPLCTKQDNLGLHFLPNDIMIGDVIAFKQIGAYGFTNSMPFFLSHDLPGEAIISKGGVNVIREPTVASQWLK